jgi:hypothetical protein
MQRFVVTPMAQIGQRRLKSKRAWGDSHLAQLPDCHSGMNDDKGVFKRPYRNCPDLANLRIPTPLLSGQSQ